MRDSDVSEIEAALGVKVPSDLRRLLCDRHDELRVAGCFSDGVLSPLFLTARAVVDANQAERSTDTATFFPRWWESFFLTGTNGAGDFYCLRLDDSPGLWIIGSDADPEPILVAESLAAFVDERLEAHRVREAEVARRQAWIGAEQDAERRAAQTAGVPRAVAWVDASSYPMHQWLDELGFLWSEWKFNRFRAACAQRNCTSTDYGIMGDLLREVLGNPFARAEIPDEWRSPAVVELATTIESSEDFSRLAELGEALAEAGCDDERVLAHCRRVGGHVPGCWVVDRILKNDPVLEDDPFTWSLVWPHPTLPPGTIEKRFQEFGDREVTASGALRFADWLESCGDATWAEYVRVRLRLDRSPPDSDYADLVERRFELGAAMRASRAEFEGFYFGGYRFAGHEWWEDETDDFEWGLPASVDAVPPSDGARPLSKLLPQIEALVGQTPVRGMDFREHYADRIAAILESSGGRRLRRVSIHQQTAEGSRLALEGLCGTPAAAGLERLKLWALASDHDCTTLANTPFEKLSRLDFSAPWSLCSPAAIRELFAARWFRELRQLKIGFREEGARSAWPPLPAMPHLQSLTLESPVAAQLDGIGPGSMPNLKRLRIHGGRVDLLATSPLIDLSLEAVSLANRRLFVESWGLAGLQSLAIKGPFVDAELIESLAEAPFAAELRILRIDCGNSACVGTLESLVRTPLVRPGAFPKLTTLEIVHPFKKGATRDAARFLERLATPNLRHLSLDDVDFDDACAEALATRAEYSGLRRLHVHQGYGDPETLLSPNAAEALFRSANLSGLVELDLHNLEIQDAVLTFADPDVMPNLGSASLYGTGATRHRPRMRAERPEVRLG